MSPRRCFRGSGATLRSRSSPVAVLLAALSALALAACGATHQKLDLPRDQVAEVRGLDEHPTFGMGRGIAFEGVDGKRFASGTFASLPMAVDVLPGKHVLRCRYSSTFDGLQGPTGSVEFELEAKAGAIYQGRFDFGVRGEIRLKFTELTREQVEAARAKEKKVVEDTSGAGG